MLISGCSGNASFQKESLLGRNWGRSYESAIYSQMVNPDANKNLEPVLGLDGTASNYNVDKYKESFKKEEQRQVVNILQLQ